MITITAFNEEGEEWILTPTIDKGGLNYQAILHLRGPIGYYLDIFPEIFERTETRGLENFCIDAGGRNFGSKSSVFVKVQDIKDLLEKLKTIRE